MQVGAFWGCTNPLLKRGSQGIDEAGKGAKGPAGKWVAELLFLLTRWQWLLPFAINQCGSLVYYVTLGTADLAMAVPISNSVTFLWTFLMGW